MTLERTSSNQYHCTISNTALPFQVKISFILLLLYTPQCYNIQFIYILKPKDETTYNHLSTFKAHLYMKTNITSNFIFFYIFGSTWKPIEEFKTSSFLPFLFLSLMFMIFILYISFVLFNVYNIQFNSNHFYFILHS